MKKSKKILAGVACAMALVIPTTVGIGVMAATKSASVPVKAPTANNTAEDTNSTTLAVNTLHLGWDKVNYDEGVAFEGYSVVYDTSHAYQKEAAAYLKAQVEAATGKAVVLVNEDDVSSWDKNSKYIVFSNERLEDAAGYVNCGYDLGIAGYHLKTIGNSVFLHADGYKGFHLGTLAFLRAVIGFEAYGDKTFVYTKDGSVIPTMDIIERPDFDSFDLKSKWENVSNEYYDLGVIYGVDRKISVNQNDDHNSFWYLPPDEYYAAHNDWYSAGDLKCNIWYDKDRTEVEGYTDYPAQLCYTARGDDTQVAAMQQVVADRIVDLVVNGDGSSIGTKYKDIIMFGAQDQQYTCTCTSCQAIVDKYGNIGPAVIEFVNGVSDKVQAGLGATSGYEDKQIKIMFYAYQQTRFAPNAQALADGYKCNDNVVIYMAASRTKYSYGLYDPENIEDATAIQEWAQFGELCYWVYSYNSMAELFPTNSFEVVPSIYRYLKEYGGMWLSDNISPHTRYSTGFASFKTYLSTQVQFDVNSSYKVLKEKFFNNYYGAGGAAMEQFFDEMVTYMNYMRDTLPKFTMVSIGNAAGDVLKFDTEAEAEAYVAANEGSNIIFRSATDFDGVLIHNNLDEKYYWKANMIEKWYQLCNEAIDAIEASDATEDEQALFIKHVDLDALFPKMLLCSDKFFSSRMSSDELKALRTEFKAACETFGITSYGLYGGSLEYNFGAEGEGWWSAV